MHILSLFASNFTKEKLLQFVPQLTQHQIDAATKHTSVMGPGQILNSPMIYRIPDQIATISEICTYALYFQGLGFGTVQHHLSSGEKQQIPKAIRNAMSARIIAHYLETNKQTNKQTKF